MSEIKVTSEDRLGAALEFIRPVRQRIATVLMNGMDATKTAFNPKTGDFVESDIPDHVVRIRSAEIAANITGDIKRGETTVNVDNRKNIINMTDDSAASLMEVARKLTASRKRAIEVVSENVVEVKPTP